MVMAWRTTRWLPAATGRKETYFRQLEAAYTDVAKLCSKGTWLVQVVGFNDAEDQLQRYLVDHEPSGL